MEESLRKQKNIITSLKLPFQPFLVCIGSIINPECFYVIVDINLKYKFEECSLALDFLFKLFFSIDCNYPKHSDTLWLFIQRAIYGIKLPTDSLNVSLTVLLGQIEQFLKVQEALNTENEKN